MDANLLAPLLIQLSQTTSGQESILNLRKSSVEMRNFLDTNLGALLGTNPPLPFMAKLTSTLAEPLSEIDYDTEVIRSIARMVQTPPPPFVKGLFFNAEFPPSLRSAPEREIWMAFLNLWKPRLISLTITRLKFPLTFFELDFLSSSLIKTLVLQNTTVDRLMLPNNPQTFPPVCIQSLTQFRLTGIEHGVDLRKLVNYVKVNHDIQVLQVTVTKTSEIASIIKLIRTKRDQVNFHLLLEVKPLAYYPLPKNTLSLCDSIKSARCRVNLFGMSPASLNWLLNHLDQYDKPAMLERVLTLDYWKRDSALRLDSCENLMYLGNAAFSDSKDIDYLPHSIQTLKLELDSRNPLISSMFPLSVAVLQLEITNMEVNIQFVAKLVDEVFGTCWNLERLGLHLHAVVPQRYGTIKPTQPPHQSN